MQPHTHRWLALSALISLAVGVAHSHVIEPGVRVEKIMVTPNTPALRIFPATLGPHPIALLAHGGTGSKENLFRFGEALAAAGFNCFSVDQAGHGESPQRYSLTNIRLKFRELERVLGEVDVFVGHSMGGGAGSWSVREDGFRPKLFIAVDSSARVGERGPPLLLLVAQFSELMPRDWLRAQTNAQIVISPWSEHITAVFDSTLVNAGVKAACAAVGKPVPAPPTAWRWRLAGLVLGAAGGLGLMFSLPELHPRFAGIRRFIVPGVLLLTIALTLGTWVGVTPVLRRIPTQLLVLAVIWRALTGASRRRIPRWSLAVPVAILAPCSYALAHATHLFLFALLMAIFAISPLLLLLSAVVGNIAARGGSRRNGAIAMAVFAGYVIGQFLPLFY